MIPVLEASRSFAATRWMSRKGLSRRRFEAMQGRQLDRWLNQRVPRVAAYHGPARPLTALPVIDKSVLMADFAAYNTHGVTAEQVREAMARDLRIGALTVGASTGTSGNRGLFVISEAERFRWLGNIVAKTLADILWQPQKIAILLPQATPLYESANRIRRFNLRFFDLHSDPDRWMRELNLFDPTVIVAPPRILRLLAEGSNSLAPRRVFSAAETLDPVDRPVIEARFGSPLGQIYMATEGLLGVTCEQGRLHLAEDAVYFEFEPFGDGLVSPLITTFRRDVQIMARYRMNDLLRISAQPCPCGSPLVAVDEVVGRMDDCFHLAGRGGEVFFTPDVLRNAVLDSDPSIQDFRLIQTRHDRVELILPNDLDETVVSAAQARLSNLFVQRGATANLTARTGTLPVNMNRKLRRVERRVSAE
ncbi:MAG: F390 synthetase-related protein [Pseudomonadota bacterium]